MLEKSTCRRVLTSLIGLTLLPALAQGGAVHVRGTYEGAVVRLPDVAPGQVTVTQPEPLVYILTGEDADWSTSNAWPSAHFVRRVQVFGPEMLGEGQSRVRITLEIPHPRYNDRTVKFVTQAEIHMTEILNF